MSYKATDEFTDSRIQLGIYQQESLRSITIIDCCDIDSSSLAHDRMRNSAQTENPIRRFN